MLDEQGVFWSYYPNAQLYVSTKSAYYVSTDCSGQDYVRSDNSSFLNNPFRVAEHPSGAFEKFFDVVRRGILEG
jgi:hypothetical protein